jgi:outer membrane protein assembly factor BamB
MRKYVVLLMCVSFMTAWQISIAHEAGEMIWQFQGPEDHCVCVTGFSDVDGDNRPDVVGFWGNSAYQGEHNIYCLSGPGDNGNPVVIWSAGPQGGVSSGGGWGDQCLERYPDNDSNGVDEIMLGTAWGGRCTFLINGTDGSVIWVFDSYVYGYSGWCYSVHTPGDMTWDDVPDVISGFGSSCDRAFAFDGTDGSVLWEFQADDAVFAVSSIPTINWDDIPEAIIGTGDPFEDRVICINGGSQGQGEIIWQFHANETVWDVERFVDINEDGLADVLAAAYSDKVYALSAFDGTLIWEHDIGTVPMEVKVGGDQNNDGIPEVLVASWDNALISLDGATGNLYWRTEVGTLNGGDVWTIDNCPDVDGDGIDEVVGGSFDYNVYLCSGVDGEILWQFYTNNRLKSVRAAGDLNGDGYCDIIAGTQYTYTPNSGKMFAISGGASPDVFIDMLPDTTPVVVYPGGYFTFTGILTNHTDQVQVTDVGVFVMLPNGTRYGPVQRFFDVTLDPHETITVPYVMQTVPNIAPPGEYKYVAYCGQYPTTIVDSAFFEFTVVTGAGGTGGNAGWEVIGWQDGFDDPGLRHTPSKLQETHPVDFAIHGNYPNPFNASTNVNFSITTGGNVELTVYNLMGQKVVTLVDGYLPEGVHSINWNASGQPSGIYYARLTHNGKTGYHKMTLVK